MIDKNDQPDGNCNNSTQIMLIANKRKVLEANSLQVQQEIRNCFAQLSEVLQFRERQLLRQAEAIHTQQLSLVQSNLEFLPPAIVNLNGKQILEEHIRQFGRIELSGTNCLTVKDIEPYKVAYYQEADKDHVSFDKSIKKENITVESHDIKNIEINEYDTLQLCKNVFPENVLNSPVNLMSLDDVSSAEVSKLDNTLKDCKQPNESECLPSCSPLLVIKQKHNLMDKPHKLETKPNLKINVIENSLTTSVVNGTLINEINTENRQNNEIPSLYPDSNMYKVENADGRKEDSGQVITKEYFKNPEMLDSYEHPKQVQQWLQQILVETEIEPMIHEIGQFSELSEARLCNDFQLET